MGICHCPGKHHVYCAGHLQWEMTVNIIFGEEPFRISLNSLEQLFYVYAFGLE